MQHAYDSSVVITLDAIRNIDTVHPSRPEKDTTAAATGLPWCPPADTSERSPEEDCGNPNVRYSIGLRATVYVTLQDADPASHEDFTLCVSLEIAREYCCFALLLYSRNANKIGKRSPENRIYRE
ncbi:hypothetical protein HNO88_002276 [Novosphingobium chloroacetimidivorans]|uniref:Uncharacterized protein n=1 Tax=Novosphingobium chloroacetimidivorans TaxID=1428314 RepID=A0A7W7NX93_9SPHN|nr:hypothetical protein [Novosphingobium chloroacetimidivorans]MBB4858950.1 hypothetical protein [Novosphingobium chloroacetimidivorans]